MEQASSKREPTRVEHSALAFMIIEALLFLVGAIITIRSWRSG